MSGQSILALILFLAPLAYSPGPGNAFFAVNGALHGAGKTIPALAGYHIATFFVTAAIGAGLSLTVLQEPRIAWTFTILSALYMLWLAAQCFMTFIRAKTGQTLATAELPPTFGAGVMLLLLNPKAYAIILLMFGAFVNASSTSFSVFMITAIFTLNNFVAFTVWAIAGQALAIPLSGRTASLVYAFAFVAVAIWLLATHQ
jgi:threonine/homoserine/homoserine lactone efflux protein